MTRHTCAHVLSTSTSSHPPATSIHIHIHIQPSIHTHPVIAPIHRPIHIQSDIRMKSKPHTYEHPTLVFKCMGARIDLPCSMSGEFNTFRTIQRNREIETYITHPKPYTMVVHLHRPTQSTLIHPGHAPIHVQSATHNDTDTYDRPYTHTLPANLHTCPMITYATIHAYVHTSQQRTRNSIGHYGPAHHCKLRYFHTKSIIFKQ